MNFSLVGFVCAGPWTRFFNKSRSIIRQNYTCHCSIGVNQKSLERIGGATTVVTQLMEPQRRFCV